MPRAPTPFQRCTAHLRKHSLLMSSDARYPSVTTIVAGEPVAGSWWDHASGKQIYAIQNRLLAHKDVLAVKLIEGKVTLVHRKLWPDVLAMAVSGAPWQVQWLPRREAELLDLVEKQGRVVVDESLSQRFDAATTHFAKELEARLLVLSHNEHTESGAHARVLTSWWTWAQEKGVAPEPDEDVARARLDAAARSLAPRLRRLPWWHRPVRFRFGHR